MMNPLLPLLLSLFLCGCAAQNPPPDLAGTVPDVAAISAETTPAAGSGFLQELESAGSIDTFLPGEYISGFLPMGRDLVLFSGTESVTLTLLDTQTLMPLQTHDAGILPLPDNATIQLIEDGLSYFDSAASQTVILDHMLREVKRIDAAQDLTGSPFLSKDGGTLYYCTPSSIRALDISSGISRTLKESSYPSQTLCAVVMDDTVLQVSITDTDGEQRSLFLSAQTGQLLNEWTGHLPLETSGSAYCATIQDGSIATFLFGSSGSDTMILHPSDPMSDCVFLPDTFSAVTAGYGADGGCRLELYDLESGHKTASVELPAAWHPVNICQTEDGMIWFLALQEKTEKVLLCRWNTSDSPLSDSASFTSPYHTRDNPDYEGLAACTVLAQDIGSKYGVEVLIYKDAVALEPWDYHLEYEYQVPVLRRELEQLDHRLGNFPDGLLQTLAQKFTALKFCIVRSAVGSPESGSQASVNGIQFWDQYDAYIVLASEHDTEYALYHELCHLIDTVVLTESTAYDRWDALNPVSFRYDNDYIANRLRDGSPFLQPGREYFIDTYSMSWPKEDRARILEYAMTPGHEALFQSPFLQAKLRQLCIGIREAFHLEEIPESFLWEQYLSEPITQ